MIWDILPRKYDDLLNQLLFRRGVDLAEKDDFLEPDFSKLHDPFLMKGIKEAVDRIQIAVEQNEVVGIFGDYDADGIPGAALLYKALAEIGLKTFVHIPNREAGYGLSKEGIDYLISKKCSLIVTVDLGIRNFKEALYCREKKIDLIITDHHTPDMELPKPDVLINPKIKGDRYPFKELSGCGVAYKLVQALSQKFPKIDEKFLKWNLDLVAIATISDVVPLLGENRILAKYGLMVLQKTKNIGLIELYKVAGLDQEKINSYITGFQIAPRINAPGRVDHATKSLELLITEDKKEAIELADWLNEKNEERQRSMDRVETEACEKIIQNNLDKNNLIIVDGDWPKGVIGPTGSRLVEKFSRPVILFSDGDDRCVGSARSVEGVNILEIIESAKELAYKFGGHKGAAGITVLREKFNKFKSVILSYAKEKIDPNLLVKKIKVESEISAPEIKMETAKILEKLEPYGMGNPRPIFYLPSVSIYNCKKIGKEGTHMSFSIKKDTLSCNCVYFNFPDKLEIGNGLYDLLFTLQKDRWQDKDYLKMFISDIRESCEKI